MILLAAAALTLLGTAIEAWSPSLQELATKDQQRTMLGAGAVAGFFASLAGLLVVTCEFRYGTILRDGALPAAPSGRAGREARSGGIRRDAVRNRLHGDLDGHRACVPHPPRRRRRAFTSSDVSALLLGTTIASALTAMLGVAVGALIRNQVGAIVALVAYGFLVDATVFAAFPRIGHFLPGKAGDALSGSSVEHLLAPAAGGVVLVAWNELLAFVAAAAVRDDRTDI